MACGAPYLHVCVLFLAQQSVSQAVCLSPDTFVCPCQSGLLCLHLHVQLCDMQRIQGHIPAMLLEETGRGHMQIIWAPGRCGQYQSTGDTDSQ